MKDSESIIEALNRFAREMAILGHHGDMEILFPKRTLDMLIKYAVARKLFVKKDPDDPLPQALSLETSQGIITVRELDRPPEH